MEKRNIMTAVIALAFAGAAYADILWQDDDPATPAVTTVSGGMTVTPVASTIGNSATIGLLNIGGGTQPYMNLNGGTFDATPYQGQTWSFSFDYYIPSTTVAQGADTLYINFTDGVQNLNDGWIGITANADDTWHTFTWGGTVDAAATTLSLLMIYTDNWGTAPEYPAGTAMYLDNIKFEAIPEPATIGMIGLFGGAILFIRRRFQI